MSNEVSQNITVSRDALYQVLRALIGQPYLLGELRATRSLHKLGHPNPIETLIEQFNACAPTAQEAPTAVAGPSEFQHEQMDAMALAAAPKAAPVAQRDAWLEAAIAWEVCASIHRRWAKGKDAFYSIRQSDFQKHAEDARAQAAPVTQRDAQTAGLIAAAEHIEGMASGYLQEHAYTEPDTGAVVFDRRDAGEDYYNTLVELAEDLRAMVVYSRDQAQEGASHD